MRSISRRGVLWVAIVGVTTAALVASRSVLDKSHFVLAYLLLVLIGTSRTGRRGGVVLAVLCFFSLNFFLLPPYHSPVVQDPRDWFVLLAFLVCALIAAQLLHRAQDQTAIAQQRNQEVARLATLGAETLSVGRAEEAIEAVARVIQSMLNLGSCEIFLPERTTGFRLAAQAAHVDHEPTPEPITDILFEYLMTHEAAAVQRVEGGLHVIRSEAAFPEAAFTQRDARAVVLPLRVRDRVVGLLRVSHPERVFFDEGQRRFAETLSYYAALAVERARLTADAERAGALEAADRVKNEVIAAVSHDLRTPLTAITGLAHEIRTTGDERALIIETEANRLNQMVGDLLELSRLNAGAVQLEPGLNAIEDLLGALLNQLSGLERSADLRVQGPSQKLVLGRFDFVHTLRALVNLVDNAMKYSPADSPIDITIEENGGFVEIAVHDRGSGVAPDHLPYIFEPFVRLPGAGNAGSGAGLGLAIAQKIAAAQGGEVRYAPRTGGGSTFTLVVPHAEMVAPESGTAAVLTLS